MHLFRDRIRVTMKAPVQTLVLLRFLEKKLKSDDLNCICLCVCRVLQFLSKYNRPIGLLDQGKQFFLSSVQKLFHRCTQLPRKLCRHRYWKLILDFNIFNIFARKWQITIISHVFLPKKNITFREFYRTLSLIN